MGHDELVQLLEAIYQNTRDWQGVVVLALILFAFVIWPSVKGWLETKKTNAGVSDVSKQLERMEQKLDRDYEAIEELDGRVAVLEGREK